MGIQMISAGWKPSKAFERERSAYSKASRANRLKETVGCTEQIDAYRNMLQMACRAILHREDECDNDQIESLLAAIMDQSRLADSDPTFERRFASDVVQHLVANSDQTHHVNPDTNEPLAERVNGYLSWVHNSKERSDPGSTRKIAASLIYKALKLKAHPPKLPTAAWQFPTDLDPADEESDIAA